jgi:hypothetical protein
MYKKPAVSSATNKLPRPKNIKVCCYCNLNIYLPFNCTIIASVEKTVGNLAEYSFVTLSI